MTEFMKELYFIDSRENHLQTLDNVMLVYLSSEEANCHKERIEALVLINKLRELFM